MQLNDWLLSLGMALLYIGLLCTALSQQKHFRHRHWAGRFNRIGLRSPGVRRLTGTFALLGSAGLMVFSEGWGFGLVLWLMAAAALAALLAWMLAHGN
ncbi:MAG: DUF3325 family protein [Gammaproteobacteria bacterium]|uniref:DUF3325 family protein n=1 Tax=Limnobacter sp. TaxID=2003368 RepID=UPI001E167D82|nr:DUF3325 family protein [Limnobacter sp.]MBU0784977.1 DUF3325 family protein [Gammaproteobacteria bacterium]MBU0849016.1 DUF3325 family protein [Gammaproteobacteria bacterium]MBU1266692.1 DUF3325 family protein [Gammaproteobacteria bacterium]MBU1528010.1 DUF3325 family protein [Gammaproteobacteria bacterium]MBU1781353.1 DUF3325 family protein [Gammaproteobacteria bacterium]